MPLLPLRWHLAIVLLVNRRMLKWACFCLSPTLHFGGFQPTMTNIGSSFPATKSISPPLPTVPNDYKACALQHSNVSCCVDLTPERWGQQVLEATSWWPSKSSSGLSFCFHSTKVSDKCSWLCFGRLLWNYSHWRRWNCGTIVSSLSKTCHTVRTTFDSTLIQLLQ